MWFPLFYIYKIGPILKQWNPLNQILSSSTFPPKHSKRKKCYKPNWTLPGTESYPTSVGGNFKACQGGACREGPPWMLAGWSQCIIPTSFCSIAQTLAPGEIVKIFLGHIPGVSDSACLGWGLGVSISNKLPQVMLKLLVWGPQDKEVLGHRGSKSLVGTS